MQDIGLVVEMGARGFVDLEMATALGFEQAQGWLGMALVMELDLVMDSGSGLVMGLDEASPLDVGMDSDAASPLDVVMDFDVALP